MTPISKLPPELVIGVTDHLYDIHDIAALVRTSKKFFATCNPVLYRRVNQIPGLEALPLGWGAWNKILGTVEKALAAGADPNHCFHGFTPFPTLSECLRNLPSTSNIDAPGNGTAGDGDEIGSNHAEDNEDDEDDDDDLESTGGDEFSDGFLHRDRTTGFMTRPMTYTALHIAVLRAPTTIVEKLLDGGADINATSNNYCSCDGPHEGRLPTWYRGKIQERNFGGMPYAYLGRPIQTPLHMAVCSSELTTAKFLIKRGADLVSKNSEGLDDGCSAIFLAARHGDVGLLKTMFECNPGYQTDLLEAVDSYSLTPLYHACASQCWNSTVPFLLQCGASLEKSITINHENFQIHTTMLGEACYTGNFLQALRLLDAGARITGGVTITPQGPGLAAPDIPPWTHAANEPLPLLHACCHEPEGPVLAALSLVIRRLVKAGALLEEKWGSMTALHFAARSNIEPAVRTLLGLGANVNVQNELGMTPLMSAVLENVHERHLDQTRREHPPRYPSILPTERTNFLRRPVLPVLKCLLEFGASVYDRDSNGKTALHHLFTRTTPRHFNNNRKDSEITLEVGRLLLLHGADPCAKDREDMTPFQAAFRTLDLPMCQEMLKTHRAEILQSLTPSDIRGMFLRATRVNNGGHCKIVPAIDLVLGLDATGCICSDKDLFLDLFRTRSGVLFHVGLLGSGARFSFRIRPDWSSEENTCDDYHVANTIFRHGISEEMGLTPDDWTAVLIGLIVHPDFRQARDLMAVAMRKANLNQVDSDGKTIIYHLLRSPTKRAEYTIYPKQCNHSLITDLVDAGADVYMPLTLPNSDPDDDEEPARTETPFHVVLRDAASLTLSSRYMTPDDRVEYILRTRPIPKSNSQPGGAKFTPYLHYTVEHMNMEEVPETAAGTVAHILRLLLDHGGADPAERDQWGNTALAVWLYCIIEHVRSLRPESPWYDASRPENISAFMVVGKILGERLSVDVLNAKDKRGKPEGKSAVDLAEEFLQLLSEEKCCAVVDECFEVVPAPPSCAAGQEGEEGWKMIRWW